MNILLSGGWGYGNLGDEAILKVSLSLISKRFPLAKIILLSYNPSKIELFTEPIVNIESSAHRVLFNRSAFEQLGTYGEVQSFRSPLMRRAFSKLHRSIYGHYVKREQVNIDAWNRLELCFRNADIFIMSGGGYFNNWEESFFSRCTELELAVKYHVPSYIVGQSFDYFYAYFRPRLELNLRYCKKISVRDSVSIGILKELGIDGIYSPDLVLSHYEETIDIQNEIAFVPATCNPQNRIEIAKGIVIISTRYKLKVNIIITRLYIDDIFEAQYYYSYFKKKKVDVSMQIPSDIGDVIRNISRKKYIISRNLHGLILGMVYGGEKLLCLSNQPKFVSFMEQIGKSKYVLDMNIVSSSELVSIFEELLSDKSSLENVKKQLSYSVTDNFNKLFD